MAARSRTEHSDAVKTRIQTTQLVELLQGHALGKRKRISPDRIKAAEILLARTLPTLQSIEQTQIDPRDKMTRDEILASIQALIAQYPGLLAELNALAAQQHRAATQQSDGLEQVQTPTAKTA